MSLSKPWSTAEAFHILGSLAKVPLMKRPLTVPAKKSLGKYKQPAELRLWFRFWTGAGGTLYDFSGYGINGAITGMVWAKSGGLTVLQSAGNRVDTAAFVCPTEITVAVSMNFTSFPPGNYENILCNRDAVDTDVMLMREMNLQTFRPHVYTVPTTWLSYVSATAVNVGEWHTIVETWRNPNLRLYVDGVEDGNSPAVRAEDVAGLNNKWYLGSNPINVGVRALFGEARVYGRALSDNENRTLHLGLI